MDFCDPFFFSKEIVPSNDFVFFDRLTNDVFVAATNFELVFYQFDDILVEIVRKKIYSKILDLKCCNFLLFLCGESYMEIIRLEDDSIMIVQSIKLSSRSKMSRFDLGFRLSVCNEGIATSALQENFCLIPFSGNVARYDKRYLMKFRNNVIWDFDIVGKESNEYEHNYVVLIISNLEKKLNEVRLLKTNFRNDTRVLTTVCPKKQNSDQVVSNVRSTPSKNGSFITIHGQLITLYRASSDNLQKIREIVVQDFGLHSLITAFGWCEKNRKELLMVGCENGDIFQILHLSNNSRNPEKKRICQGLPVCSLICDISSIVSDEVDNDDDEEEEEELEEEGESNEAISDFPKPIVERLNDEEEDEDDDSIFLFFLFEKAKPLIFEIIEEENKFSPTYSVPYASPILDFDVNNEKMEFLVGSSQCLFHLERGIQCGLMFQSPMNSYPGISRLMITKSSTNESALDSLIFLSCGQIQSTNILKIETDGEIIPLEQTQKSETFETNDNTIQIGCILSDFVLQVTSRKALLVMKIFQKSKKKNDEMKNNLVDEDEESDDEEEIQTKYRLQSVWNSNETISHASVSPKVTVLGSNSNHIQLLEIVQNKLVLSLRSEAWIPSGEEITCISQFRTANYFGVGCFSGNVFIYDIQNLVMKVKISMADKLPEKERETCCVESLVIEGVPDREEIVIVFAGLRNGWIVIQEMFITEQENAIIKRSFVEKIGVEPVQLEPCPNLPFQVSGVSSRVVMIKVRPDEISILPLSLMQNHHVSKMVPLFTHDHQNTILTVSEDQRLEIWKMNPSMKYISTEYLNDEKCYRVFFLEYINCYLFFCEKFGGCKIGVFYKENDSLTYRQTIIHQFLGDELAYGFDQWIDDLDSSDGMDSKQTSDSKFESKEKIAIMIDEDDDEEEEDNDEIEKSVSSTETKKLYFCVGTTKNRIYKFEICESQEQTSKKRIFRCRCLQMRNLKIRSVSMKDEDDEKMNIEQQQQQQQDDDDGIVYCIRRFKDKYIIASSSEKLLLLDFSDLKTLSESRVRHFVSSIECSRDVDLLRKIRLSRTENSGGDLDSSFENMNIYVTDRYDSIIVLRIEEHTKSFLFLQSDVKSRCNMKARIFSLGKVNKNENDTSLQVEEVLVGADRMNNELVVMKFKEDELERKIMENRGNKMEEEEEDEGNNNNVFPNVVVSNDVHVFSEVCCQSSQVLEDVPSQIKVWKNPRSFDREEIVIGALVSGKIFQLGVIPNKFEYLILHCLETTMDEVLFSSTHLSSVVVVSSSSSSEGREWSGDVIVGDRNNEDLYIPPFILGRSYLQHQKVAGKDEESQRILNHDFLGLFLEFPESKKLKIVELMNKSFGNEILERLTVENVENVLRKTNNF